MGAMLSNKSSGTGLSTEYRDVLESVSALLEEGRRSAARTINAVLTATYWLVGKRLVEFEQGGRERAAYGSELLKRLSSDLGSRLGRGFSERNLEQMRLFYLQSMNPQTLSANLGQEVPDAISLTPSAKFVAGGMPAFSLSWSHYVRLLSVPDPDARRHYEEEHSEEVGRFVSLTVKSRPFRFSVLDRNRPKEDLYRDPLNAK